MKRKTIKSKFLLNMVKSYSVVLIIITTVFTIGLYLTVEESIKSSAMQYQKEVAEKTAKQVDDFLGRMDDVASRVMSDTNVVILFTELSNDYNMENYFRENILSSIDIGSVLKTINSSTDPVWRMSVYDQYGDFIFTGTMASEYDDIANRLEGMKVEKIMSDLKSSNRIVLLSNEDRWSYYFKSEYISVLRPVMNKYARNVYAVVEIQEDVSKLKELLKGDLNNTQFNIYDENENLIISQGEIPEGSKTLKSTSRSEISGWRIELITLNDNKSLNIIAGIFILTYLIIIASIVVITYILASRITKPLQDLRLEVNKLSPTNISIKTNDGVIDEIKELSNSFSEVLVRIGEAAVQEKKAYSLALQSQMNPHFLFNTLSVISAAGMESDNDKIVDMCHQLSDILRYVASYESSVVPFKEEIVHAQNYLKLMEARYEDCFVYNINVDNRINNVIVPKLILQPLVENCFKDAFINIEPPWNIYIDIGIEEDNWYIKVQDNGIGFSETQIKAIDEKVTRYSKNIKENYKELKIGGLGLVSTITRLRLSCDENVEYTIENLSNRGTVITIRGKIGSMLMDDDI
ncbi:histidine kinase [Clostridium intestinale]|uniref:sensor histidine kinase n=1 Tax=Clostridium intestinale TaxID=36845 RepID=UPI0028E88DFD|nr:histidine kinase [Clostridium intestinale]